MPGALDRLERILEDAEIGVWQLHVPSGQVTHNEVLLRMMQSRSDLVYDLSDWAERIHPGDRELVLRQRRRLLAGELEAYWVQYRLRRVSGDWISLRARVSVSERDTDGKVLRACGILTDITHERELSRLLHAVFDRPFQFIGLLTPEGVLIQTNQSSIQDSGHKAEDLLGKLFWEGPLFAGSPALQAQLRQGVARAARGELVRFEMRHPNRDGLCRTIDFTLTPLRDDDGTVVNIIPEGRDISDLAMAREALQATQQRLNTATESANIGLWEAHLGGGVAWFSDQYWLMLGYQPGELPATFDTAQELAHPDDRSRLRDTLRALQAQICQEFDLEYRVRRKDGSFRCIQCKGQVIERAPDGSPVRVSGVQLDVTERKEAAIRLAAAERLESMGRLAAGVSHEINTPMQYVNDNVYFIREGVQELLAYMSKLRAALPSAPEAGQEMLDLQQQLPSALDSVIDGMARVAEIVRSMKEFSHPDHATMRPADLNRAIQSTLIVARSEFKHIADLETNFAELPPVMCHGGQINQVVLNLVVNAAHAIADVVKGTDARGLISIKTFVAGSDIVISIADNGGGIPEGIRHRIFEPFFTTKDVGRGTGQGLAIARNVIVHGHGGALSFETQAGEGTTFTVRLPIQCRSAEVRGEAA